MSSSDDDTIDDLLASARRKHDTEAPQRLNDRVDKMFAAFRELAPLPPWIDRAQLIGSFDATLATTPTRTLEPRQDVHEAVAVSLPDDFDGQVNVMANGSILEIEIDVDPGYREVWATVAIADTSLSAVFKLHADDERLRTATVPYGGAGPVTIQIVQAPEGY